MTTELTTRRKRRSCLSEPGSSAPLQGVRKSCRVARRYALPQAQHAPVTQHHFDHRGVAIATLPRRRDDRRDRHRREAHLRLA